MKASGRREEHPITAVERSGRCPERNQCAAPLCSCFLRPERQAEDAHLRNLVKVQVRYVLVGRDGLLRGGARAGAHPRPGAGARRRASSWKEESGERDTLRREGDLARKATLGPLHLRTHALEL
jgi:hypothetical protein